MASLHGQSEPKPPLKARAASAEPSDAPLSPPGTREELGSLYTRLQKEFRRRTVTLASAAHELKTPIAILNGYAALLLAEKLGPLTPKQREVLLEMQETRSRLQHFIEDFLNYSAITTGSLKLRIKTHDLNECLTEIYKFWQPRFEEKLIAFYFLESPSIRPFPFDYAKAQHVISNLLQNALKFTPAKGTVWLAANLYRWERRKTVTLVQRERRTRGSSAPNSVRITVSDTGPGISPELHSEIFEDFARPHQTEDRAAGGFGLGLAIARSLVTAHQGRIWVESAPGAGSKFCILLPLCPKIEDPS